MIPSADRLKLVDEYYFSQKLRELDVMRQNGASIINLGIGSPDMAPHPSVIEALKNTAAANNTHAYQSYKGVPELRKAMQQWYQKMYAVTVNADTEILPLMGSKEGIMHLCMAYLNPGDTVLAPNPGYPTYTAAALLSGATIAQYTLLENEAWQPDFNELEAFLEKQKVKLLFVNYPNMPTGAAAIESTFVKLIDLAHKYQFLIVHDNPYSFVLNEQPLSILSISNAIDVAVELNSLSKSHNMAGWRVGMLVGNSKILNEVLKFKSNMDSGMFLPVQKAAVAALNLGEEWYQQLNNEYQERRNLVFELLTALNCKFNPEQKGMFVWAAIPNNFADGFQLSDQVLADNHLFITPGGIFGSAGNQYVRVSLCATQETFREALKRLKQKVKTTKDLVA